MTTGLALYLWRHAKAAKGDATLADFDRPLTKEGVRGAAEMAGVIAARNDRPTRIICSTAQRTRETLAPFLAASDREASIDLTRRVYDASTETLLSLILREPSGTTSLMLIGHNPGLETLARLLAGSGDEPTLHRFRRGYPPGAFALLRFEAGAWAEIAPGDGTLVAYETPTD